MSNTMPGHPYIRPANHASKGIKPQDNMGGGGVASSFTAKTMKLGGGGRFAALAKKTSPAIAASIGRKKYGAKKMAAMAAKGREK